MDNLKANLSQALGFGTANNESKEGEPAKKPGTRTNIQEGGDLVAFDLYAPARKPRVKVLTSNTPQEQVPADPQPSTSQGDSAAEAAALPTENEAGEAAALPTANVEAEENEVFFDQPQQLQNEEVVVETEGNDSLNSKASTFNAHDSNLNESDLDPANNGHNEASLELEYLDDLPLADQHGEFPGEQLPPQFYNPQLFEEGSSESSDEDERENINSAGAMSTTTPEYDSLKALIKAHAESVKTTYFKIKALKDDIKEVAAVQAYLESITAIANKLLTAKENVFSLKCNDDQRTALLFYFIKPEEQIQECRTWARVLKDRSDEAAKPINQASPFAYQKRTLAKFSGDNADDYERFRTEFDSMLQQYSQNQNITDLERFQVLRDHTTGQANRAIKNLTNRNESFKQGLEILDKLFNKPIQRVSNCYSKVLLCKRASGFNNGYNSKELNRLHGVYYNCTRTMETMGVDPEENAGWLYTKARLDFPSKIIADFDDFHADQVDANAKHGTKCKFSAFLDFVLSRMKSQFSTETFEEQENAHKGKKVNSTANGNKSHSAQTKSKPICNLCGANHVSIKCNKWKMLQQKQMIDLLKQKKLCMICGDKHFSRDCTKSPCFKCGKPHNTKICLGGDPKKQNKNNKKFKGKRTNKISIETEEAGQEKEEEPEQRGFLTPYQGKTNNLAGKVNTIRQTILDTLVCLAIFTNKAGKTFEKKVRIFLDTGSEINLITRKTAEGATSKPTVAKLEMTAGLEHKSNEKLVHFQLKSLEGNYISKKICATTLETVTKPFKAIDVHPSDYSHLKDLTFTEKYPSQELHINMLLGNEICAMIATSTARIGKPTEPIAKKTRLGWVLSGIY